MNAMRPHVAAIIRGMVFFHTYPYTISLQDRYTDIEVLIYTYL